MHTHKILLYLSLLGTLFFGSLSAHAANVDFYPGSYDQAFARAQALNQPILLYFTASYCGPCDIIEENTFTQGQVAERINQNFIPLRSVGDHVSPNGILLAQRFSVITYPTFLIVEPNGSVAHRWNQTFGSKDFLDELNSYLDNAATQTRSRFDRDIAQASMTTFPGPSSLNPRRMRTAGATARTIQVAQTPTSTAPPAGVDMLYQISVLSVQRMGFALQVGVFSDLDHALDMIDRLENETDQVPVVHIRERGATKEIRIMVGPFASRMEAEAYRARYSRESFVKDLSQL